MTVLRYQLLTGMVALGAVLVGVRMVCKTVGIAAADTAPRAGLVAHTAE